MPGQILLTLPTIASSIFWFIWSECLLSEYCTNPGGFSFQIQVLQPDTAEDCVDKKDSKKAYQS